MNAQRTDLTIDDALSDPMIAIVMKADRVDPRALRDLLQGVRDARVRRARCLDFPFTRTRDARPWARVMPPPAGGDCGAARAW